MNFHLNISSPTRLIPILIFLCFGFIYSKTSSPFPLNYADSDDLTLAAYFGTTAHPPGYPILTLLLHPILKLVAAADVAYTANLANALISALMLASLYLFLNKLAPIISNKSNQNNNLISAVTTFLFGLSTLTWRHATVLEVFPLSQLFLVWFGIVSLTIYSAKQSTKNHWYLLGFLASLNGFHHQLTWPLVLVVVILLLKRQSQKQLLHTANLIFSLIISLVSLFFLYSLTGQATTYGWGIGQNLIHLLQFYLRLNLRGGGSAIEQSALSFNLTDSISSILTYFKITLNHFGLASNLLIGWGFWLMYKGYRNWFFLVISLWLLYGVGIAAYLKFPQATPAMVDTLYFWGTTLVERMLFIGELLLTIPLWLGVKSLFAYSGEKTKSIITAPIILIVIILYQARLGWISLDLKHSNLATNHTNQVFTTLPPDVLLLADSDVVFSFLYHQLVLGLRPDLTIIPVTTIMRENWFDDQMGQLYHMRYPHRLDQALEIIKTSSLNQIPIHLYDPDPKLLIALTQQNYNLNPEGWTVQVINSGIDVETRQGVSLPPSTDIDTHSYSTLSPKPYTHNPKLGQLSFWHQGLISHQAGQLAIQSYYLGLQGQAVDSKKARDQALNMSILPATKKAIEDSYLFGMTQNQVQNKEK